MNMFLIILTILFVNWNASADTDNDSVCGTYNSKKDVAYNSVLTVTGTLRENKMLAAFSGTPPQQFAEISLVLVSQKVLVIQQGEVDNPVACSLSEFTLYLNDSQLLQAREWMKQGKTVVVSGVVRMAESSIEEYDNATLVEISDIKAL